MGELMDSMMAGPGPGLSVSIGPGAELSIWAANGSAVWRIRGIDEGVDPRKMREARSMLDAIGAEPAFVIGLKGRGVPETRVQFCARLGQELRSQLADADARAHLGGKFPWLNRSECMHSLRANPYGALPEGAWVVAYERVIEHCLGFYAPHPVHAWTAQHPPIRDFWASLVRGA